MALPLRIRLQFLQQRAHVGGRRRLSCIATREGEIGLQHTLHFLNVFLHGLEFGAFAEQGERQFESRQHRAQIVADAIEHRRALLHRTLDAAPHLHESVTRLPHLTRALRAPFSVAPFAEILRGLRQPQNGPDLVAQEGHRDGEQHERSAEHPDKENMRIRRIGRIAVGDDAHHRIFKLDADFDEARAAHRINPERPPDLRGDLARQSRIENREKRFRQGRRQRLFGQELHVEPEPLRGDLLQQHDIVGRGIGAIEISDGRNILHHRRRQTERHQLPVTLHEEIGDGRLQHDHRHDDDEQRARVKPLRHIFGDAPREIAPGRARAFEIGRKIREAHARRLTCRASGDSLRRAPSADAKDWWGRSQSCGAGD